MTVLGRMTCATDLAATATATKEGSTVDDAGSHEGRAPEATEDGNGQISTDEGTEVSTGTPPNSKVTAKAKGPIASNDSCMEDITKEEEPLVLVTANPSWASPDLHPRYDALLCSSVRAADKHCAIVAVLESTLAALETTLAAWELKTAFSWSHIAMLTMDLCAATLEQGTWSRAAGVEICRDYDEPSNLPADGAAAETTGPQTAADLRNEL